MTIIFFSSNKYVLHINKILKIYIIYMLRNRKQNTTIDTEYLQYGFTIITSCHRVMRPPCWPGRWSCWWILSVKYKTSQHRAHVTDTVTFSRETYPVQVALFWLRVPPRDPAAPPEAPRCSPKSLRLFLNEPHLCGGRSLVIYWVFISFFFPQNVDWQIMV